MDIGYVKVPVHLIPMVAWALREAGDENAARSVESFANDYGPDNENRLNWIAEARAQHQKDGEVEIDEEACISESEDGCYVMAWVWVYGPPKEDD